jgi:mRNA interferase HigB
MVVISKKVINEFSEKYPNSSEALLDWYKKTKEADWSSFNELKQTFNSADAVGNGLYVFNIKGNHYRLIARIIFGARTVFIKFINTHSKYDKVNLSDL